MSLCTQFKTTGFIQVLPAERFFFYLNDSVNTTLTNKECIIVPSSVISLNDFSQPDMDVVELQWQSDTLTVLVSVSTAR